MLKIFVSIVNNLGFEDVLAAKHGVEALEVLRENEIDLLLTDWNMPVMDGVELLKQIHRTPKLQDLPALVFTAHAAKENIVAALRAGADSYIVKPFTRGQLKSKMDSIMGKRSVRQLERLLLSVDKMKREADHPLVIFGEAALTVDQFSRSDNEEIAN